MQPTLTFRLARAGSAPPERDVAVQRAKPFGAAVGSLTERGGSVTLVTHRSPTGITSYVTVPMSKMATTTVNSLASAVGAQPVQVDALPDLTETPEIGWLEARPSSLASRDTQAGGDQTEVAILLSRIMRPGSWVALSLRAPTRQEVRHVRRWVAHRLHEPQTHYTNDGDAVVATITAGGTNADEVAGLLSQLAAVIPGFDVETVVRRPKPPLSLRLIALVAVVAFVAAKIAAHTWTAAALAVAGVFIFGVIARLSSLRVRRLSDAITTHLADCSLPPPAYRLLPPRSPVRKVQTVKTSNTLASTTSQAKTVERPGGYPLAPSSFLAAPSMLTGVVSPHAGVASGIANTVDRSVPDALLTADGPVVGYAMSDGTMPNSAMSNSATSVSASANSASVEVVAAPTVHFDAAALYTGVAMYGVPGSGKTIAVRNLWGWHTLERVRPSGRPAHPGRASTLIAFESKGEGAAQYERLAGELGDRVVLVEVGDPTTPAIDLCDPSLPATKQAQVIVSAMVYAFGEDAIGDRSTEVLSMVFPVALLCPPEIARTTADITDGPVSFMSIAHILLCGRGDEAGVALDAALASWHANLDDFDPTKRELGLALSMLEPLYGPKVTPTQRRALSESSRNKVSLLASVPHWWNPSRPRGTWGDILVNHASVVVNTGITRSGGMVDERLTDVLTGMAVYTLRDAIQRNCSGWLAQGKTVTIFSDELALLARSTSEVIEWCRDAGRSYGVRLILATQRPEQLSPSVRSALRGFGNTVWFQQSDPTIVSEAVAQLSLNGTEWTSADIANLPQFHAIVRATAQGRVQPPVPIRMAYWESAAAFVEASQ